VTKLSWTLTTRKSKSWDGTTSWKANSRFPFRAKCVTSKIVSPLRKGEVGEVSRMAPEDVCSADRLALIRWQGRKVAVPLSQLVPLDAEESTIEAAGDWHYWAARGYRL
jgi:Calcium binding